MIVFLVIVAVIALALTGFLIAAVEENKKLRASLAAVMADRDIVWTKSCRYRSALWAIRDMRTAQMANIGHRMVAAAKEALKG